MCHSSKLRAADLQRDATPSSIVSGQVYSCKAGWYGVDDDEKKKKKRPTLIIGNGFDCRRARGLSHHYFVARDWN
ncbi:hypothetical protein NHJ13051_004051 [Beauveria bassiana]